MRYWHKRRTVGVVVAATLLAVSLSATGCATGKGHHGDDSPHPVEIEINNNFTVPTTITVFIQGQNYGRKMLGTVPGGDSARFIFKPDTWGTYYRLFAERQLAPTVTSNRFNFSGPSTGSITWNIIPNIVTTYEMQVDTVVH